mmetsp:Transcript_150129/g.482548  ORF Transcript_150129/g.482548 Transcript_150129/m.482548 type:complete len:222 (-) Transcript_150129:1307-1972(-)
MVRHRVRKDQGAGVIPGWHPEALGRDLSVAAPAAGDRPHHHLGRQASDELPGGRRGHRLRGLRPRQRRRRRPRRRRHPRRRRRRVRRPPAAAAAAGRGCGAARAADGEGVAGRSDEDGRSTGGRQAGPVHFNQRAFHQGVGQKYFSAPRLASEAVDPDVAATPVAGAADVVAFVLAPCVLAPGRRAAAHRRCRGAAVRRAREGPQGARGLCLGARSAPSGW